MKNPFIHPENDSHQEDSNDTSKNSFTGNSSQKPENAHADFNEILLSSLPYPAMYVRLKDRIILAANKIAIDYGAKVGGHCWREFGKTEYLSEKNKEIALKFPDLVPEELNIKCSFCMADECIFDSPSQIKNELKAFGKIWDTYWIKVSDEIFLHYLIDITERKKLEESLRENEHFLKQTQQIAMLGTSSLDFASGHWVSSEILDTILGIDKNYDKTFESLIKIIHPDWQKTLSDIFRLETIGNETKFNGEFKIIRQSDKAERWVHAISDVEFDDKNEPIKMIGTIRDITERKHEQSLLTRNLKFTEALLKSIPIPIFFKDTTGAYTGCNEACSNFIGFSIPDIIGKTVMDIFPIERANIYLQNDLNLFATQKFQTYEETLIDSKKRTRDVIFAKDVFYDENGNLSGIVGTFLDITERKQLEESLRESEHFLKQTQQIAMLGTFSLDVSSRHWVSSEILDTILGIDTDYDKTFESLIKIIHPNWQKTLSDLLRFETIGIETKFNGEFKIIRLSDKAERWVHGIGNVEFNDKNEPIKMIGTIRDITERKHEQSLVIRTLKFTESLLKSIPIPVFFKNTTGAYTGCNEAFSNVMGVSDADIKGKTVMDLWPSEQAEIYHQNDLNLFATQKFQTYEATVTDSKKRIRDVIYAKNVFYDENGHLSGIVGTFLDITERKQLEESLRQSEQFLKQTQQIAMLGTFSMDVPSGNWVSSEILDTILGIDTDYDKTFESLIKIVHPDWQKKLNDIFRLETIGIKTKFNIEFKIIRPSDKAERWVHGIGHMEFNDKNKPIKMIGTIRDITERKQGEEERKFLIAAIENTDDKIAVKDLNLRVIAANKAWINSKGETSIKNLLGKTDAEVLGVSPDSQPVRTYMKEDKMAQKLAQGEFIQSEISITLPNGENRFAIVKRFPIFNEKGNVFCTGEVSNDITDRKKAEDELWLKNISFDTAKTSNSFAGLDKLIKEVNEAFLDEFGYKSKDEVIGKPFENFFNDINEANALLTTLIKKGQWEGDFMAKRADGSTFNAHGLATIVKNKNGKIIVYQSSIIDITARKQMEEALRKSQQMLLTVLEHFPGVVFWKDRQSNYLGCNQAFATAAGLNNPDEIVGKTDFDLPWSKTEAANYLQDDYEVMEKGNTIMHIIETQHQADDKVTWFDTNKIPLIRNGGGIIGVMGVSIDITDLKLAEKALKESEEKYRTIADFTNDWEYWLDPNDNFIYCSPSCERITGYDAFEFIQNPKLLHQIIHPNDIKIFQKHIKELLIQNNDEEIQFRIICFDGQERWIGHVCQPVYNEFGVYIGIRGSNRDITERKKTEERLKHSERRYKLISQNMTDGVFISKNGYIEYINPSMIRIFGYDASELVGLKLTQLIIPERRDNFEEFITFDLTSDQVNSIEIECMRKDKSILFVDIFLNHVASEMQTYGVISFFEVL